MQEYATLRAFVAVAHTGSVSKAAEQLHLTQPAVSLKLKQLQQHLGLTLSPHEQRIEDLHRQGDA